MSAVEAELEMQELYERVVPQRKGPSPYEQLKLVMGMPNGSIREIILAAVEKLKEPMT